MTFCKFVTSFSRTLLAAWPKRRLGRGPQPAGAQELSEEEPCAWEAGRRHRCEEEPAQQGLVTALVVILVVFLVVILVFFLVQTGFLKRKRGGKKMTGVDDLVRTSSA